MKLRLFLITMISLALIIISIVFNVIVPINANTDDDKTIVVGGKLFPEQNVLIEVIAQLIEENTDLKVIKKKGIIAKDIHEALINKEIDLYPEYTGTIWVNILEQQPIGFADILYNEVKNKHLDLYDVKWLKRYGFDNSYGLAMKKEVADEMGIETYSDLSFKGSTLILGGEDDFFAREDAYPRLTQFYKFKFKETKVLEFAEKYESLDIGEVDVINIFLTDGTIEKYDLIILEDDLNCFIPYEAATIIRMDTLEKYPELEAVLNKLGGQITDAEIRNMNKLIEEGNMDPDEIAGLFLKSKGLIPE